MAFETTRQEILKQAIELKKLYDSTRIKKYKDEELRLRRIAAELSTISLGGAVTQIIAGTNVTVSPAGGTGAVTINASGGQFKIDYDPNITGVKNGSNLLFTTSATFIATTTRVFLNGQRLTRGATYDYVETGTNQITFAAAPVATDQLIIEYQI
jgi:hypothetical protein